MGFGRNDDGRKGAAGWRATIVMMLFLALDLATVATGQAQVFDGVPTVAVAVDVTGDARKARITFTLSRVVDAKAFVLERPDRVIIDLPEVNFQLPGDAGRNGAGLVGSFRYGLFAPGRSRIVIDLKDPALVSRLEGTTQPAGDFATLTVELARADRAAFRQAALKPVVDGVAPARLHDHATPPLEATGPSPPEGATMASDAGHKPLIMLDPGHGGVDPGAVTAQGVQEKTIVFAFTQRLKDRIEASGKYRVLMTRDGDSFVTLPERVRLARQSGAVLFISIHADALNVSPEVRGATIYTGADFATDAESAQLADKENRADAVAGVDSRDDPEEVAGILMDLTKRETRAFSGQFARTVAADLQGVVKLNKNPHRSAGFRVLRAPDVPSVLIELGYLSSAKDADLLTSDTWRDRTTEALTEAIDRYFATRVAKQAGAAVSP